MTEHPFAVFCAVPSLWLLLEAWLPTPSCLLFLPVARLGRTMSAIRTIKAEQSRRFNCVVDSAQGDQGACRLMLAKKDYLSNKRGGNLFGSVGIVERSDP